ncbi:glycosyltransferase [Paracoccus sp. 1_MG-2023]|uniref:glycosyltransferase family 2 protein n=1 Tax=unclassified Paracoccus (in: a-proteobacteria) TaxID=2688777 RepID=UPI001C0A5B47|nr:MULTISPECIES: glycosyltransferase [unclassified Paracoccus (in: a-proteobacteria)]MBU2958942.1 glycosyltransferase [Paracoccus sp. C2R09]MDO6669968.1 glycosyltransferase [Paracoccus sp. 1_MG-2023]
MTSLPHIDAVAIGRNEGDRLLRCLDSLLAAGLRHVVYVDSGSTDGSIAAAEARGVTVVRLDMNLPFTAARARNAGVEALPADGEFVQFVDGDCSLDPGWIGKASAFLKDNPAVAAVCGRRREIAPEASIYNRLIDREWDTPPGRARSCGGDVLMRRDALAAAGGFDPRLIAGEEPELCVRLRQGGWQIWRLDAEMTRHDADIHRFGQWWKRCRRAGHAYAEGAALHGAPPERHNIAPMRRALLWGLFIPLAALAGALLHPAMLLILLAWPLQILRLAWRDDDPARAVFLTMGKIPEAVGIMEYHFKRLTGRRGRIIEYK